ncbi:metallophosphoesterase [Salsuginibacillus kocurii]|uniref:metallophosphoesterase n=1 Tax=Salsuginibacillus kocurii TaxID=427078 RepID=UPI00036E22F4|nr:metallophosphoesterase [Salsuginibacillus kocurii]
MKNILIISDTHGDRTELAKVIARHANDTEAIIHCGDSELEGTDEVLKGVNIVKGNCDFGTDFSEETLLEIEGQRVFVTHGHLHNVKMTHLNLLYRAEESGADLVCFGHSHSVAAFHERGVVFVNPGSLLLPRQPREATYAICRLTEKGIEDVRFFERDSGEEMTSLRLEV